MKAVRFAGAAVPALGMIVLPATVANAATTAPHQDAAITPAVTCAATAGASDISTYGNFGGYFNYQAGTSCIHFQEGVLAYRQSGLTERVRFRNTANSLLKQTRLGGTQYFSPSETVWSSTPNYHAYELCQALVDNGTSTVVYGAVCGHT